MRRGLSLLVLAMAGSCLIEAADVPYHLIKEISIGGEGGCSFKVLVFGREQ